MLETPVDSVNAYYLMIVVKIVLPYNHVSIYFYIVYNILYFIYLCLIRILIANYKCVLHMNNISQLNFPESQIHRLVTEIWVSASFFPPELHLGEIYQLSAFLDAFIAALRILVFCKNQYDDTFPSKRYLFSTLSCFLSVVGAAGASQSVFYIIVMYTVYSNICNSQIFCVFMVGVPLHQLRYFKVLLLLQNKMLAKKEKRFQQKLL